MEKYVCIPTMLILLIVFGGYVSGSSMDHNNISVRGYVVNGQDMIFLGGTLPEENSIYLMDVWGSGNNITSTLTILENNMNLTPLASYRVKLPGYYPSYSNLVVRYRDGFLVSGALTAEKNSKFTGGFWLSFINRDFNVVWTKAYLTRFSSSISKIIYDNNTGKLFLIGEGCFYSGSDGFFAVFNPKTLKIEKAIAIGGMNADGISEVLTSDNRTYILFGSSWSLGDAQEKMFLIKLDRDFNVIGARAYTILNKGSPVERLLLYDSQISYKHGRISVSGRFRVDSFTPNKTILKKAGLWWVEFDNNLNLVNYTFKTTTLNSRPIELGGVRGLFKMKKLKASNETVLVADVPRRYPMVMVGKIENDRIVGGLIGAPYPGGIYTYLTYPYTVFFKENSMTIFLDGRRFSDRNFVVYNYSTIAIDIPYDKINDLSTLKNNYLYGGNITVMLHPWKISFKAISTPLSKGLRVINIQLKPANTRVLRVNVIPTVVTLHNPRPVGYLNVVIDKSSYLFTMFPKLYLDGARIKSNKKYPLPAGIHTLTVKKQGFRQYNMKIETLPDAEENLFLNNIIGFINIKVMPPDANFTIFPYFNGQKVIHYSPIRTNGSVRMILPTGWYNITVRKKGYHTYSERILVSGGEEIIRTIVLIPKPAYLFVDSTPKAEILINGSFTGETPQNISMFYGDYQVTLSAPGYKKYSFNVTLAPGGYLVKNVTLRPIHKVSNKTISKSLPNVNETIIHQTTTVILTSQGHHSTERGNLICGPAVMVLLMLLVLILSREN